MTTMRKIDPGHGPTVGDFRNVALPQAAAAAVLEIEIGKVRAMLDRRTFTGVTVRRGDRLYRDVTGFDILKYKFNRALSRDSTRRILFFIENSSDDSRIGQSIENYLQSTSQKDFRNFLVHVISETASAIEQASFSSRLIGDDGSIEGTGIKAHRIAALVEGGTSRDEILRDYPGLSDGQIVAAVQYAKLHPKQGRPFPARTVKSVLRKGGGGGLAAAFDAAREDEE